MLSLYGLGTSLSTREATPMRLHAAMYNPGEGLLLVSYDRQRVLEPSVKGGGSVLTDLPESCIIPFECKEEDVAGWSSGSSLGS